jgi:hypothetical protein
MSVNKQDTATNKQGIQDTKSDTAKVTGAPDLARQSFDPKKVKPVVTHGEIHPDFKLQPSKK